MAPSGSRAHVRMCALCKDGAHMVCLGAHGAAHHLLVWAEHLSEHRDARGWPVKHQGARYRFNNECYWRSAAVAASTPI
jgi:hypothetical protein